MKYGSAAAFRRALEDRLAIVSTEGGLSIVRLRKLVTFDRLLARLVATAPDSWLLKGAVALDYRLHERARSTMDVDVERRFGKEAMSAQLLAVQEFDLGDHFRFRIEQDSRARQRLPSDTVRYLVEAELAGRTFEQVHLDVGPPSPCYETGASESLSGPDLLGFAGLAPVTVLAIPLEQHLAEKIHAYTRTYVSGPSNRPKDLVDILLIRSFAVLSAGQFRLALERIFTTRATHHLPATMPAPPAEWELPYAKLALELGLETDSMEAHSLASAFLNPVLGGLSEGHWIPLKGIWEEQT